MQRPLLDAADEEKEPANQDHAADWKTKASAFTHLIRTFIEESTLAGGIIDLALISGNIEDQAFDLAPKLLQSKYAWIVGAPWGAFMAYFDALGHVIRDEINQPEVVKGIAALRKLKKEDDSPLFDDDYIANLKVPFKYLCAVIVHVLDEVLSWPSWSNMLYEFADGRLGPRDTITSFIISSLFGENADLTKNIEKAFSTIKPVEHTTFLIAGLIAGAINYFTEQRTYSNFAQTYYFWQQHRHLLKPDYEDLPDEEKGLAQMEVEQEDDDSWWCGENSFFGNCLRQRRNAASPDERTTLLKYS